MKAWQVLESRMLVSERWLELSEQRVQVANGNVIERFHLIKSPDWASVVCVTSASELVLVRQYRHGIAQPSLELPAGVIEAHETPEQAARRELLEETGFESDDWAHIQSVATEPARHTTRAHFYCARHARRLQAPRLEATEVLDTVLVPLSELERLATDGSIVHGVHVGALLAAAARGLV